MSIFNTNGSITPAEGKIAVWHSGTSAKVSSISFTVDARPTEWALICVGAPTQSSYAVQNNSSYYMITSARSGDNITSVLATCVRYYNYGVRFYKRTNDLSGSYGNKTFTLTSSSGSDFFYGTTSDSNSVYYYLFYSTN